MSSPGVLTLFAVVLLGILGACMVACLVLVWRMVRIFPNGRAILPFAWLSTAAFGFQLYGLAGTIWGLLR
jgi:hypothetical protein